MPIEARQPAVRRGLNATACSFKNHSTPISNFFSKLNMTKFGKNRVSDHPHRAHNLQVSMNAQPTSPRNFFSRILRKKSDLVALPLSDTGSTAVVGFSSDSEDAQAIAQSQENAHLFKSGIPKYIDVNISCDASLNVENDDFSYSGILSDYSVSELLEAQQLVSNDASVVSSLADASAGKLVVHVNRLAYEIVEI